MFPKTGLTKDKPELSNHASDEQTAIHNTSGNLSVEKSYPSCRCGQGGANNNHRRLFCENHKSGFCENYKTGFCESHKSGSCENHKKRRECAFHMGSTGEITEDRVAEFYNQIVLLIRNDSIQKTKDKTLNSYLEKIDKEDISAVKRLLREIVREEEEFKEKVKQQIDLNVDVVEKSN